eukprot:SAG11_NODE_6704_length_1262_cov_2.841788_1_plen_82_part_00
MPRVRYDDAESGSESELEEASEVMLETRHERKQRLRRERHAVEVDSLRPEALLVIGVKKGMSARVPVLRAELILIFFIFYW